MSFKEGLLSYPDGTHIRYRINEKNNAVRPMVLFIHDLYERLEFYDYLYPYFDQENLALNAIELRGHGLSGGAPLHIDDCELYLKDIKRFVFGNLADRPLYIIGVGLGALLAVRLAEDLRFNRKIMGLMLFAPKIELRLGVTKKIWLKFVSRFSPAARLVIPEDYWEKQTHAEEYVRQLRSESERQGGGITIKLLLAIDREIELFMRDSGRLKNIPAKIFVAGEDSHLESDEIEQRVKGIWNSSDISIVHCKSCYHALLLDKERINYVMRCCKYITELEMKFVKQKNINRGKDEDNTR